MYKRQGFTRKDSADIVSKSTSGSIGACPGRDNPERTVTANVETTVGRFQSFRILRSFGQGPSGEDLTVFYDYIFQMGRHGLAGEISVSNKGVLVRPFKIMKVGRSLFVDVKVKILNMAGGLFHCVNLDRSHEVTGPDIRGESVKQTPENIVPFALEFFKFELLPFLDRLNDIANSHNSGGTVSQPNLRIAGTDGELDFPFLMPFAAAVAVGDKLFTGFRVDIEQKQFAVRSVGGKTPV